MAGLGADARCDARAYIVAAACVTFLACVCSGCTRPLPMPALPHSIQLLHPPPAPAGCRGTTAAAQASQSQPTPSRPPEPRLLLRRPQALLLKRQLQRRRRRERRHLGMGLHSRMQRRRVAPASSRATLTGLETRYTMCRAVHRTTKRGLMSRRESAGSVVRRRRWLPAGARQARSKRAMQCLCLRYLSLVPRISRAAALGALRHTGCFAVTTL